MPPDAQAPSTPIPRARMRPLAVEFAAFVSRMFLYEAVRHVLEPESADGALAHAEKIVDIERGLGLFVEPDVQRAVQAVPGGEALVSWLYTLAHTAGFSLFFLWVWLRHRDRFPFLRNWFWVTNGIALLGYWLYPLAPPRLAGLGLSDPTAETLDLGGSLDWFQPFRNLVAAMPSMHVGYTVLFAAAIVMLLRSRWRWLALLWPGAMLVVVMSTANHYWLDGAGGALAVGLALAVTLALWPRLRRPWTAGREE
jgi:hypothetical protein